MTTHPQIGDVFTIPTGDGRVGIGQVVAKYGKDGLYLAVFEPVVAATEPLTRLPAAIGTPIQFLALSLDAKFHAGHWSIVARLPVPANVPLPAYKETVESAGRVVVEVVDYSGARRRRATPDEVGRLPNRKIIAPVRLERALRASLGLEPWLGAFDELRPAGITSGEAFP